MNTTIKAFTMGLLLILVAALVMVPAAACGDSHYTCGPRDFGTCPNGQGCQCHTEQVCGWGDWNNGRCPVFGTCQERSTGHGHWEHRHYTCHDEQVCGCVPVECNNGMGFRVSIPSSPDPTPYNIGTAPATVDFWSNPYPNIEDPFPAGTTFLWDFGDGTTSTEGPSAVYHTYTTPGIYDVTLTVTFPDGCPDVVTETKEDYLLVTAPDGQSRGPAHFSNPYWDQIGGCPGALNAPTGSLPTTGNGDIVVKAISCIIDARGDKYGCTAIDGMKLFYRANDDGVFLPTCAKRCYFGGCDIVTAMGGYPLTATARNPQEKLRAVVCKPYGDTYDVFTIQVTFEKPGMETVTMSTKDSCFDQTLSIGAYCGGCRISPSLAAIFHPAWIAPADSPLWDTCQQQVI